MSKMIAKQYRKPSGLLGKIISGKMEKRNEKTYRWVMPLIKTIDGDKILEIGYGAGTGINSLACRDQNITIYGIDFSRVMYKKAVRKNKIHSDKNQIFLSHGDLLTYTIEKNFSKIFGINVLYFWNDLGRYFTKIFNLLKENGALYLYMSSPERLDKISLTRNEIFNKYTLDDVIIVLSASNFKNIRYETNETDMGKAFLIFAER